MNSNDWWYLIGDVKHGPISEDTAKNLGEYIYIWKMGMPEWTQKYLVFPSPTPPPIPQAALQPLSSAAVWTWAFSPLLDLFIRGHQFTTPGYYILWFIIQAIFFAWDT